MKTKLILLVAAAVVLALFGADFEYDLVGMHDGI
jgi:hypothetical protein